MKKYRLKKTAVYSLFGLLFVSIIGVLVYADSFITEKDIEKKDYEYINKTILEDNIPVLSNSKIIAKPYNNNEVKIVKDYYDYTAEKEKQVNSIIYYESTYMQNNSIAYGGVESFDVVSILDGTVTSIKEDDLLGNIIEIEHDNKIISVYQSVSDVKVKENQVVKQGELIALSGKSNLNKSLENHLLFELIIDGNIVNPEEYYNKNINEL